MVLLPVVVVALVASEWLTTETTLSDRAVANGMQVTRTKRRRTGEAATWWVIEEGDPPPRRSRRRTVQIWPVARITPMCAENAMTGLASRWETAVVVVVAAEAAAAAAAALLVKATAVGES